MYAQETFLSEGIEDAEDAGPYHSSVSIHTKYLVNHNNPSENSLHYMYTV